MTCKRSKQCDHADLCQFAKSTEYNLLGGSCFTPKDPQTNEEWLRTATTEQLAEEILAWWTDGANTYSEFGLYNREIEEAKERIVKWLKQPHTVKEYNDEND